jgi:hypothetical protein
MSVFTGTLSEILAAPGGIVLGFGGESLSWQPLNLFLKVQEPDAQEGYLPLHTLGVTSGVAKVLPLVVTGKVYGATLNLYIECTISPSQRNMNLFVEGGGERLSGSLPLHTVRTAEDLMGSSLSLFLAGEVFTSSLNLVIWRTEGQAASLPLTVSGYALEATGSCVLYLEGPLGLNEFVTLVTAGTGATTSALPLISEGF